MSPITLGCVATWWVWTIICASEAFNAKRRLQSAILYVFANGIAAFALHSVMR